MSGISGVQEWMKKGLEECVAREPVLVLARLVAAAKLNEYENKFASEHDTPATGYAPWLFIRSKHNGAIYNIMDSDMLGKIYGAVFINTIFKKKYKFLNTECRHTAYNAFMEMTYEEALKYVQERRKDLDDGEDKFEWMVDDSYEEIRDYFEPVRDLTFEQARKKYYITWAS